MRLLGFMTGLGLVGATIYMVSIGSGLHQSLTNASSEKETVAKQLVDRAKQVSNKIQTVVEEQKIIKSRSPITSEPPLPKSVPLSTNTPLPTTAPLPTSDPLPTNDPLPTGVSKPSSQESDPQSPERETATPQPSEGLPNNSEASWYPLWSPFRSELSAQGFADRLAALSGRSLRVAEEGPSRYRVQLAYSSADDLHAALLTISKAVGLDLTAEGL